MPFYYEVNRSTTTNTSQGIETTHLWAATVANQQTFGIYGVYFAPFATAATGTAVGRVKTNLGATASGGTAQTPRARTPLAPAAQSVWKNDASAITAGGSLTTRISIGFAQAGGLGGWAPLDSFAKVQMMANATNPVDIEFTSIASANSVPFDMTVEFSEGA
jgi:hypothetical protein